ncbi:hypothetical protein A2318_00035 [Candidatus Uhrbacteria bacterium RIFOXYB2_FULL_45_11]|uniref:ABC transporter domain-containing protein n=1 Tax=Candidatus Uhrbacteria bacterium RIFOXYB2_FULL_45_11 TaxID=1802421 RepID=A0A1F7W8Z9_9BACT|nr:MAG: hypothetical protein A2318_00035 [Candidatus Uhrbacteria bacterium RIFOXYB2_FULL_45_11]
MENTRDIILRCETMSRHFGPTKVLAPLDIEIERGQIVSIVGSSGCGKSTILNIVVGSLSPSTGRILVSTSGEEREVDGHGRDRGMVYQKYSLFEHLTAIENVAFGPMVNETTIPGRMAGRTNGSWQDKRHEHLEKAKALLVRLGLGDALHRYPIQLSGGMAQRVAIARALIMEPQILLLDEPFGALDEETRGDARQILRDLRGKITILMITHSLEEAVSTGDRVIGLSKYWNWKEYGHRSFPGATTVYDKACPVFAHADKESAGSIMLQADELRAVVFPSKEEKEGTKESTLDPKTHCPFWQKPRGVL